MVDRNRYRVGDIVKCVYAHNGMGAGEKFELAGDSGGAFIAVRGIPGIHPADCVKLHKKCVDAIVITTDGEDSKARLMKGKTIVREVKLKRSKEERHNLKILAAYAVQKLLPMDGNMIMTVKAGYTGSVAVVGSKNPNYTDGKILEFVSGKCVTLPYLGISGVNTIEDLKKVFKGGHFNFDVVELHRR